MMVSTLSVKVTRVAEVGPYGLARAIMANNVCERGVELYGLALGIVERPHAVWSVSLIVQKAQRVACVYPRMDSLSIFAVSLSVSS